MRITFVAPATMSGGMRVIAEYARRLQNRGHRVTVVSAGRFRPGFLTCLKSFVRSQPWPKDPRREPWFCRLTDLDHRILDHPGPITDRDVPDADIVIATWWQTAPWVAELSRTKGAKIYFMQDYGVPGQSLEQIVPTWSLPLRLITISQWLVDLIHEHVNKDAALVPNAVDTVRFDTPVRGKGATPTVGFVYAPYWSKGCDLCIQATELARKRIPQLRLVCFGSRGGAVPQFPLPGWAEPHWRLLDAELPALYASCDAWLFGSRLEGFGLPIIEAMACRTPVLAVASGAAPELLSGGGGILVRPKHPAAMAEAIERVHWMTDEQWRTMSAAARATATAHTWDDAVSRFEQVLVSEIHDPGHVELTASAGEAVS